jgi:hypothetical protein
MPSGTQVTLTTSAANEVDVWNSANPGTGDTPLLGGSGQTSSSTWTVGTDTIPSTLYVGATAGSGTVGDITFTLAIDPPSGGTGPSATTQPATAVRVEIVAENDPNNTGILNQDISNPANPIPWLVGQTAELMVDIQAPLAWINSASYQWSIPGSALFFYNPTQTSATMTQSSATTTPLAPLNIPGGDESPSIGTSQSEVQFFWVYTNPAGLGPYLPDIDNVSLSITMTTNQA